MPDRRKSYLLQVLSERVGGLYVTAVREMDGCRRTSGSAARTKNEVDIIALALGERPQASAPGSPSWARPRPLLSAAAPAICNAWNASVPCSPTRAVTPRALPWPYSPCTVPTRT
jgi:hypothetical protein